MLWAEELSTQYQEQGAISHGHCGVQVSASLALSHIFVHHSTWGNKWNHHGLVSLDVLLLLLLLILLGGFFSFENFMHTYHDKNKRLEAPRPNCTSLPIPPPPSAQEDKWPSDIQIVECSGMCFHLYNFPLDTFKICFLFIESFPFH